MWCHNRLHGNKPPENKNMWQIAWCTFLMHFPLWDLEKQQITFVQKQEHSFFKISCIMKIIKERLDRGIPQVLSFTLNLRCQLLYCCSSCSLDGVYESWQAQSCNTGAMGMACFCRVNCSVGHPFWWCWCPFPSCSSSETEQVWNIM